MSGPGGIGRIMAVNDISSVAALRPPQLNATQGFRLDRIGGFGDPARALSGDTAVLAIPGQGEGQGQSPGSSPGGGLGATPFSEAGGNPGFVGFDAPDLSPQFAQAIAAFRRVGGEASRPGALADISV